MARAEQKLRVLRALLQGPLTMPELIRLTGVPQQTVWSTVARELGRLTERDEGASPMLWSLTEAGRRWVLARMVEAGELEVRDGE